MAEDKFIVIRIDDASRIELLTLLLEAQLGANSVALGIEVLAQRPSTPAELATLLKYAKQVAEALSVFDERIRALIEPAGGENVH
jgi:hypothetical protein